MPPKKRAANRPARPAAKAQPDTTGTDIPEFEDDDELQIQDPEVSDEDNDDPAADSGTEDDASDEDKAEEEDGDADDSADEWDDNRAQSGAKVVRGEDPDRPWEREPGCPTDGIIIGPGQKTDVEGVVNNNIVTITKTVYRAQPQPNSDRWGFFLMHSVNAQVPVKKVNSVRQPS